MIYVTDRYAEFASAQPSSFGSYYITPAPG